MISDYDQFSRDEFAKLAINHPQIDLNEGVLNELTAVNDLLTIKDVQDIYYPLIELIELMRRQFINQTTMQDVFLRKDIKQVPFIIGIAGSVAVGKSTTARLLELLLTKMFPQLKTQAITTDGFLYSNEELRTKGILKEKGFPSSYNSELMMQFLRDVKLNKGVVKAPKYSHETDDVLKGEFIEVNQPNILIVEGINVLQSDINPAFLLSDYFDYSIYLDAPTEVIENWYLERFEILMRQAKNGQNSPFYRLANEPIEVAMSFAKKVWRETNLKNLQEYILPTRSRANIILKKGQNHTVEKIWVKKI